MRISISAKIFVGFLVVLATFGGVATYGVVTMGRLGKELRLVSRGYLELRLEVSELVSQHSDLIELLSEQASKAEGPRVQRFVKAKIDLMRGNRLKRKLPQVLGTLATLERLELSPEEHALLAGMRGRLEKVQAQWVADEKLFDQVYGPLGEDAVEKGDPARWRVAADQLGGREHALASKLKSLGDELKLRTQQAGLRLEQDESWAVLATLLLALIAALVGVVVMWMATRTLQPLKHLAERAKEIARGDYKQRVSEASPDEIGALGREFNAMAGALDEREQRLIRSERLATVGRMAAQITHEVRNPLSSIGLNAELLEEELAVLASTGGTEAVAEARQLARAIMQEVDRLTEITEEYLRFVRLPKPRLEREELGAIVSSLLSFLKGELSAKKITLEVNLQPELGLLADEHQLRQALLNLLRNACEAMPEGGRLRVSGSRRPDGSLEMRIADSGSGIAPEDAAHIFEPFFSTKRGGTGLGLALTQQIVVEHGGAIEVASEPGRGTTFTVRLPGLPPSAPAKAAADREPAPVRTKDPAPRRVLS